MFCGAKASEVGLATTITIIMISRNAIKYHKAGAWQDGARKIPTDRRCREKKSKIILLFGLDFTRLHQYNRAFREQALSQLSTSILNL